MAEPMADRIMEHARFYAIDAMNYGLRDPRTHEARDELAALVAEATAERVCRWTEDEDGVWWSDCGEGWCFNDGGPSENGVRFCQGCSGRIELAEVVTDG